MFAFITDFFKGRPEDLFEKNAKANTRLKPIAKESTNTRTIKFDPHLIDVLKDDHSRLVTLYGRM